MYQVLARKYRPKNFSQLVGQTHVAKALTSALERGRLHHAYLFTGTRGVGKTTIARILAKCLNCETGVTATPCETCAVCTAVNEGRFIDLIEIDAASRTGVDDTRELLNNVPYAPTQGRYKVYLIDEVHMFSNSSFNALLKTLEEPPEHVKFLFATTDPQKLPITVISRCLQFTLRPLAKDEIYHHLDNVLMSENIPHEAEGLWQLAESAQGSVRDALSLTDQAIAYGEGQVLAQDVKDMLGLIDKGVVLDLVLNIHQNRRQEVAQLLTAMRQQALDVTHVLEQMIAALHDMALLQCLGVVAQDQEDFEQRKAQIAQLIAPQDLQLYYQIAIQGRADLALALTPEQGFEMCVMRLLAFRPLQAHEVTVQAAAQNIVAVEAPEEAAQPQPIAAQNTQARMIEPENISDTQHIESAHEDFDIVHSNHADLEESQNSTMQLHAVEDQIFDENNFYDEEFSAENFQAADVSIDHSSHQDVLNQDIVSDGFDHSNAAVEEHTIIDNHQLIVEEDSSQKEDLFAELQNIVANQSLNVEASQAVEPVQVITQDLATFDQDTKQQNSLAEVDDPRQLLQPIEQQLSGEWTLEKWDYWLRLDQLSPAIKEIAQHGVMEGQIEGESVLSLDPSYQRMFAGFEGEVEQSLKTLSPNLYLTVRYQDVAEKVPFVLQQERKHQAYQAAHTKLSQHPAIQQITQEFSASIEEFQLKN